MSSFYLDKIKNCESKWLELLKATKALDELEYCYNNWCFPARRAIEEQIENTKIKFVAFDCNVPKTIPSFLKCVNMSGENQLKYQCTFDNTLGNITMMYEWFENESKKLTNRIELKKIQYDSKKSFLKCMEK